MLAMYVDEHHDGATCRPRGAGLAIASVPALGVDFLTGQVTRLAGTAPYRARMRITDAEHAKIRGTASYWAAIWLTRFNLVALLIWFGLTLADPAAPGLVLVGWWLLMAAGVVGVFALLSRSGVMFVTHFLSWRGDNGWVVRQLYRDLFWFRRR
ncbi:MAG: hypothetical protein QOE03_225 [Micromonosporaceae bacterium]|nr:hypothetical protein [Micromonosporaceae bacterium]